MRWLMIWLWRIEFARNLSIAAGTRITLSDLRRATASLPGAQMPGADGPSRFNHALAQGLHAAVTLIEDDFGQSRSLAREVARHAFLRTGTWASRFAIRAWLWAERDPFKGVSRRGPVGLAQRLWGEGMEVTEERAPGRVSLCVRSCPFCAYFWNAARSDLTPILCEWDASWVGVVNTSARPMRVELRGTLAAGEGACDFAFLDCADRQA